jgi:hypothetical protein
MVEQKEIIISSQPKKKRGWFGKGNAPAISVPAMQPKLMDRIGNVIASLARILYSWEWTKALVYWLILSAGTASDLIFLMASFWMSVNANVHELILRYMSEDTATYITYLATTAYVALPIFIVGLAVVQTVGHIKMWKTGGFWSRLWAIVFGIPAVTFLLMDFITISCSVANVSFTMPTFFVILRADSAFIFAFGSLIFFFLGKPQERERLAEKDGLLAGLKADMQASLTALNTEKDKLLTELRVEKDRLIATLTSEKASILAFASQEKESLLSTIDAKNDEIESLKSLLTETQKGYAELHRSVNQSEDTALQAYGEKCILWLKSGVKSANVETITQYTGLGTAKINNALKRGDLKVTPNNKELILISSLIQWLRNLSSSDRKTDPNIPALRLVNE